MQDKWKDLIPFYVAGTLSEDDKEALEAYLVQCGDPCNEEIEEWRAIASATWQHVSTNTPTLPPLSQAVLDEVAKDAPLRASGKIVTSNEFRDDSATQGTAPVYPRHAAQQNKNRRRSSPRVPLTMVAAFMTMVIFGGILLSQLQPGDLDPQTIIELTEVDDDLTIEASQQFGGEVILQPDTPDSGIVQTPTRLAPRPTTTPLPPPTATPLPTERSLDLPENSGGGNLDNTGIAALPSTGACTIRNDTQGALTTYRNASFEADPVGIMRQGQEAQIIVTFEGWYMLSYGNWVFGGNVTVYGDCSQTWTATPTAIGGDPSGGVIDGIPQCVVRNDGTEPISLYQWADYNSPVNGRFSAGEVANVTVGANGWYQVFYAQWVNGSEVTVEGAGCNQLWVPTPTLPSPSRTPIPNLEGTVAIVKTNLSILRGAPGTAGMFVEQVNQGANLQVIAHNNVNGPQRWYLVQSLSGRTGWIPSLDVDVVPNDLDIAPAATIPVLPTATPVGHVPTPTIENWSHITTVVEHGCGGTVGEQNTIATQVQRLGTEVIITYPETGTSFSLGLIAPNTYAGSYGLSGGVQVDLSFTSSTTYTATETVTHESGCVVRSTWSGTKQQ